LGGIGLHIENRSLVTWRSGVSRRLSCLTD
jgi:hypothetical protein